MYCKECKREISEHDKFCTYCGTYQHESNVITKAFGLMLRIFAFIFAFIFLNGLLEDLIYCLASIEVILQYLMVDIIFYVLFAFAAVLGLWMVFVLCLITFRRTPKNTPALTFGLVGGGMMMIVLRILLLVLFLDDGFVSGNFKDYLFLTVEQLTSEQLTSELLVSIQGVLICVVGVYLLLFMMRQAPKFRSLLRDPSSKLSEIFVVSKGSIFKRFKKGDTKEVDKTAKKDHITHDDATIGYVTSESEQPIKTNRSLLVYIVLNFITCGAYGWFYIYSLASDVDVMCEDDGQNTESLLAFILINLITWGFYSIYWLYRLAKRLAANAPRYGLNFKQKGSTILLCCLVGFIICYIVNILLQMVDWSIVLNSLPISGETYINLFYLGTYYRMSVIFGIYTFAAMYIIIKNTNTLAAAYNHSNIEAENLG